MKKIVIVTVMLVLSACVGWAQDTIYQCDFDHPGDTSGWLFAGDRQSHYWVLGTATNMTSSGLFVTYNGTDNEYYLYSPLSLSYAYRRIVLPRGACRFSYDWRCNGWREGDALYDFMRVMLVPGSMTPTAGRVPDGLSSVPNASLPAGYTPLDGDVPLRGSTVWMNHSNDCFIEDSGVYTLVFMWYSCAALREPPAAVDNLVVTRPLCPQAGRLHVAPLTPTSFTVQWSDFSEGNTDNWQVELCTASQSYGQGIRQLVQDTSAVYTGLTPNTDYRVYVSSLCASDTTDAVVLQVHTPCAGIATLPHSQNFSSVAVGALPSCWRVLRTTGGAAVQNDTDGKSLRWQVAGAGYCCVVLPSVDASATPSGDLQVSFRCKGLSATSNYSHEFEVGLLPNPNDVGSFVPISRVSVGSARWEQCVVEFDGHSGGNIAILCISNDLMSGSVLFDDFVIGRAAPCQPVAHLAVSHSGVGGAMVEWELPRGTVHEPIGYDVWVEPTDTSATMPSAPSAGSLHFYSTEQHCTVSGLQPDTLYRAWVRACCAGGAFSEWESVVFATLTLPCAVGDSSSADTFQIDSGAVHTTGVPVTYLFVNSLCQSIYTVNELHAIGIDAGLITGLDYTFTNNPHNMLVSIYLSTTNDSVYATADDMVAVRGGERVYGPTLHASGTSGTVHYEFDHPFSWNGVDNLVVTSFVNNQTGAMQSASFYGNSTQVVGNRTVYSYLNEVPFTTDNYRSGTALTSNYRPTVAFHTMQCAELSTCATPIATVRSVGEDYALVEWAPGYREASWSVFYRQADDSVWTLADSLVDTNYYLLTSLNDNTEYEVAVVNHCGGADLRCETSFTTQCPYVYNLPWTEDFEDFAASSAEGDFQPCWYRKTRPDSYYYFPILSADNAYSGSHSLRYSVLTGIGTDYLATPAMAMDVSQLQVGFYAYGLSGYQIRVGVMTDPTNYYTFQEVARVTPTLTNRWELKEVSLGNYVGEGRHIALLVSSGSVYVDDLTIDYIQTCPRPNSISFGIITRSTAEVQWSGSEADHYELEYGLAGFALGTGTRLTCNTDTLTLRGLNHSTRYDIYVRGFCGGDTSRWSYVEQFATACGEIESLPYTQNFEDLGGLPLPMCWTFNNASVIDHVAVGGQRQSKMLYMYDGYDVGYAILPAVDSSLGATHTLQLVVKASSNNNYEASYHSHDLIVGVCSTEGDFTTFSPLDTVTLTPSSSIYEVPLTASAGRGRYITLLSAATGRAMNNRVYIDSLAIEPIPTCARPHGLAVTSLTTTTATITWTNDPAATTWQVEYMPHGAPIGTGIRQSTNINTLTIGGLTPATTYDYYVRNICAVGDTSEWCYTPGLIVTQQVPACVPYSYGFDTLTEWNSWQTLTNCTATWCRGVADGQPAPSMYISTDSGATRSTIANMVINSAVYRDFDFGNRDTSYVISFNATVGGVHQVNQYYDGLAVFLVEPLTIPHLPSYYANESPWGSLDELTLLTNIRGPRSWHHYQFTVDSLRGVHRLVFYWYGQDGLIPILNTTVDPPGAVDNVNIQYVSCQRPYGVHATDVTAVAATLRWHGPEAADYRVMLYNSDMALLAADTVHTNNNHYEGLLPGTIYKARVGRLCDSGLSQLAPLYTFATNACSGGVNDTLLTNAPSGTSAYLPVTNTYRYSYTQQIVLASELSGFGDISSISFLYESPLHMTAKSNCTIYLGHTSLDHFVSWVDTVPRTQLQVVYVGPLNCSQGWNRILLETPFPYDGVSNLVLAIDDNSGQYHNARYTFATAATTQRMALSLFTNFEMRDDELFYYRNIINIEMCPPNTCPRPHLRTPRVRANDITLRWLNTADRYLVGYRHIGSDRWIVDQEPTTDTFFTITNYYFDSNYLYHVSQYCDSGVSNWSIGTFNTADIPCLPPLDLRVVRQTNTQAWFAWTPDDNNISYRLHVWGGGGYDTVVTTYLANGMVEELNPASRYYAAVEVRCEYLDQPSIWSDTITFETAACPNATDLVALEVHGNSVLLDWQCDESVGTWLVEWGLQGFDQSTGTTVTAHHHPFLLTGLTGETTYDIDVRSLCDDGHVSESWSNRITVTTAYSGIDGAADDLHVYLTPNPTSGDMQLTLPAGMGAVRVEVIDMAGRTLQTYSLPPHTTQATLTTSQLPQGAYYMRVTGDNMSVVKKILKIES